MAKTLLDMDRLPTMEELKEFFKKNDWSAAQISDPAKRTPEEQAEILHAAKLMDQKFEKLVRTKGRTAASVYYSKDNPLIALQKNTEDLVASMVVKIANDEELTDGILSQFDFTDPDIDQKADNLLNNAVNTMLDVMEYEKSAVLTRRISAEEDFNKNKPNNFRYIDHIRKWEHTEEKIKVMLAPDPNAELHGYIDPVDQAAISNVLVEKYLSSLDETERKIYVRKRMGFTQEEIARDLGFSNNGAVSKRIAGMRKKLDEVQNKKF